MITMTLKMNKFGLWSNINNKESRATNLDGQKDKGETIHSMGIYIMSLLSKPINLINTLIKS